MGEGVRTHDAVERVATSHVVGQLGWARRLCGVTRDLAAPGARGAGRTAKSVVSVQRRTRGLGEQMDLGHVSTWSTVSTRAHSNALIAYQAFDESVHVWGLFHPV